MDLDLDASLEGAPTAKPGLSARGGIFSGSYAEHLAAIRKLRERRAAPARQTPAPARSAPRR